MSPTPLSAQEKAQFDTLLNGGREGGGVKLVLMRMLYEGDEVGVVCAEVHGTPLGDKPGYMPLAVLLPDDEVKRLATVDGRGPEAADPSDFV